MLQREQPDNRKNCKVIADRRIAQCQNMVWNPAGIGLRPFEDLQCLTPLSDSRCGKPDLAHEAETLAADARYDEALNKLHLYQDSQPFDYRASFLEAQIRHLQGRTGATLDALEKTLQLCPDFLPAYLQIADIAISLDRVKHARKHLEQAVKLLNQLDSSTQVWPCQDWLAGDLRARVQRNIAAVSMP